MTVENKYNTLEYSINYKALTKFKVIHSLILDIVVRIRDLTEGYVRVGQNINEDSYKLGISLGKRKFQYGINLHRACKCPWTLTDVSE